jgi:hypothetical protein
MMTTGSTVDHASYLPEAVITPVVRAVTLDDVQQADEQHVQALFTGEPLNPDPDARFRLAAVLYSITGWEIFGGADERAYVSRLWAQDWDSPEDSAYDEQ